MPDAAKALAFLETVGKLKRVQRTGWWENGVEHGEHVASHMHRMAVFTLLCKDARLDKNRMCRVATMHDVAEAVIGDLSPLQMKARGITKEQKYELERAGMCELADSLGDAAISAELLADWDEYEDQKTLESKWVKDIDRLEMAAQAFTYEKEQGVLLDTFYRGVPEALKDPWLHEVGVELMKQRTAYKAANKLMRKPAIPLGGRHDTHAASPLASPALWVASAASLVVGVLLGARLASTRS